MTKKDYDLIAGAFASELDALRRETQNGLNRDHHMVGVALVASRLSYALQGTNPRFDRERFLKACGVPTN